jgi:transposase-like protein
MRSSCGVWEGGGLVLVELSVVEQRYHAVMEVAAGVPVTEVAARYGVSCQSVHTWLKRYQASGLGGLADRSHRPVASPLRIDAPVEALICRLRREHPAWGPRRLVFEVARRFLPRSARCVAGHGFQRCNRLPVVYRYVPALIRCVKALLCWCEGA